eukprot:CAMPEP_0180331696 /NCGR_PEP_ID=MMETSP0988-20121125/42075_1 /TAXON_ID=697907 /ORGANISM="non described non described, Strain CCMP2293" /LENGTH=113 /DNA_ID=CAMNT_0022319169 /DNA_START=766 /DNA_END=1110 /DNA_ORIENTATION=-
MATSIMPPLDFFSSASAFARASFTFRASSVSSPRCFCMSVFSFASSCLKLLSSSSFLSNASSELSAFWNDAGTFAPSLRNALDFAPSALGYLGSCPHVSLCTWPQLSEALLCD